MIFPLILSLAHQPIHNHVDVSIRVMKSTIDITTVVVYWVFRIIAPLFDTSTVVWMLHISLFSTVGDLHKYHKKQHIDFCFFTWPSSFMQH